MSMFCFQCQETAQNKGCNVRGVCGKSDTTANLQDILIALLKGISFCTQFLRKKQKESNSELDFFINDSLFETITNANFNPKVFELRIKKAQSFLKSLKSKIAKIQLNVNYPKESLLENDSLAELCEKASTLGVLSESNEDRKSLIELCIYGLKGIAAYAHHAFVLKKQDKSIFQFMQKALSSTTNPQTSLDSLTTLVLECGEYGVKTMALLDEANRLTYGEPEITEVNLSVSDKPGILISGHDLKDLEQLLEQSKDSGVDIYTHSEMLPAHYYPFFKKYSHFKGNYGGSWWKQNEEFEKFNGAILMTTNCITPPKSSYIDRIFTTGPVGYEGISHIEKSQDGSKDFSTVIETAEKCKSPTNLEEGKIIGGFAHNTLLQNSEKILELIQSKKLTQLIVMGGCDGRHKERDYYEKFAKALPKTTIILTAGCAKYRYIKLDLGDIEGIPRVLDAGQCNDSYSLAYTALKLKEVLGLKDINDLPIVYNIAWYEQKAVLVLLALLYLGAKKIHLGPTLPAFLSPNIAKILVEKFQISPISSVEEDIQKMIN